MIINRDDELIYENLNIIIKEFEQAALASGKRDAVMAVANNPLLGMEKMLDSSDKILSKVSASREKTDTQADHLQAVKAASTLPGTGNIASFEFDADLQELFGDTGEAIGNYLEDCLNCNLRLQFDWQLKPINLLGGIEALLDGVEKILDAFELQLNPFKTLEGICNLLNLLKGLCIQDLIIVLISLKLLLRRYVSDAINIQLDWTVILGPLLKAIVDGVASLLNELASIILAPLDCTLSALYTANTLEREGRELITQLQAFSTESVAQFKDLDRLITEHKVSFDINTEFISEDYEWSASEIGKVKYPDAPEIGRVGAIKREKEKGERVFSSTEENTVSAVVGFQLTRDARLKDLLKDADNFAGATIIEKLIVPVQEAKFYLEELLSNILKSLNSLQVLVSGGLSVHMHNIGIIMFLSDMISLVMMIIRLLRENANVSDWCSYLTEHPEILETQLHDRLGPASRNITVEADKQSLILRNGPKIVAEIPTCASAQTAEQTALIKQWLQDLDRKANNNV